jgi:hypothetical protein
MSTINVQITWKKQLTQLQMTQFLINMASMLILWFPWHFKYTCSGDTFTIALTFFANFTFFYLFFQFYKKTYLNPRKPNEKEQ